VTNPGIGFQRYTLASHFVGVLVTNPRIGFQRYTLASHFVGRSHFDLFIEKIILLIELWLRF